MRARLSAFLVILCLLCHSFAMAGHLVLTSGVQGESESEVIQHALMHWEGEPHHHGDHGEIGSVHADSSDESYEHLLVDDVLQMVALLQPYFKLAPAAAALGPEVTPQGEPPFPDLANLRRPPRSNS